MRDVTDEADGEPVEPGRLVGGRYRLRGVLGTGTTGVVWSAYDEVLYRSVAVKEVLLPPGTPDVEVRELRERTMREARAIAALAHPNVITVYDVAQFDGAPFVVMELIPGRSLASLLRGGRGLDVTQAATVADGVAAALEAAHRSGITHRDVKPGNVLIGEGGQVKLTDFGIARNVSDATMTRTGIVLGSPAFIAPEIASGEPVTPAADLWSLGATLFATVEGRPPYDAGGDVLATLHEVVNGAVPAAPSAGPLGPVVAGLMRKHPAGRMRPTEVRRAVYWLLPEPGTPAFELSTLVDEDDRVTDYARPVSPPASAAAARVRREPAAAPLSAEPGPLPFAPPPSRARRRGRVATALLGAAAVVLFACAAGGGFALTRTVAGRSLTPPRAAAASTSATQARNRDRPPVLHRVSGQAPAPSGASGRYRISVPRGWTSFTERRSSGVFAVGTVVHYVSPDGQREVTVERVPHFYPRHSIAEYRKLLQRSWPGDDFTLTMDHAAGGLPGGHAEPAREMTYRTVAVSQRAGSGSGLGRTTDAKFLPDGSALWVVSVVTPTSQEDSGSRLFARIAPTFLPG